MSTVDDRIVNMRIDNKQFLSGVTASLKALTSLNRGIDEAGQSKGLDNMGSQADGIAHRFTLMRTAALGAAFAVGSKLVNAGISLVKSFSLDPIMAGFHSYEETINATKTIMANTGASARTTGKYLKDLQEYANQTVYNFADMAKNIGTFTAAGVKLKPATEAIKGIANLAAMSGSSSQQASGAMYQLSQALAAGQVHLQDWNSVVNAGMGGKVFQTALARTAETMGTLSKGAVKYGKDAKLASISGSSFRESIQSKPGQKSWLTSDVLTKTLQQFTGEMTKAQLKAEGFTDAQAKAILKMGETAKHSATDIKTFTQLQEALKEEVATAYGMLFKTIFGGLGNATKMWSAFHVAAENALTGPIYGLNKILQGWSKDGGRTAVIQGFVNIWKSMTDVFHAVGAAWREVFPPASSAPLVAISKGFESLTKSLIPSKQGMKDITDIFKGVFSVLHAGASIVGLVFHAIFGFFGLFSGSGAGGGILSVAAALGRLLTQFDQFVSGKAVSGANDQLSKFFDKLKGTGSFLAKVGDAIGSGLQQISSHIADVFGGMHIDWSSVFGGAALGGITVSVMRLMKTLDGMFGNASGLISNIKGVFGALRDNLEATTQNVKADTLRKIAISVGILAASLVVLAFIPADKLAKGLGGIAALMGELIGAMATMSAVNKKFSIMFLAASMDMMTAAILGLAVAVAAFGVMDPKMIAQGLAGIAGTIVVMVGAMQLLSKAGKSVIFASVSLGLLAVALDLLAGSILIYSTINFETLGKGLLGMGAALVVIGLAMRAMPGGLQMLLSSVALNAIAIAITVLAGALKIMGSMSWEEIGKSMVVLAGSLVILGLALYGFEGAVVGAIALAMVVPTLLALAVAMKIMGDLNWGEIGKGLLVLTAGLSLLLLAAAGATFVSVGLLALGAAVALLGIGALAAGAGMAAFAAGLGVLVALGGAGIAILIVGIKALVGLLPTIAIGVAAAMVAWVGAIATAAPKIVNSFVKIVNTMLDGANRVLPHLFNLFDNFLTRLLHSIDKHAPQFGHTFQVLLNTGLNVLQNSIPRMANTGLRIIEALLNAIANHIPRIATLATNIVVNFINSIANNLGRIINAGTNLIIRFIAGMGNAAGRIVDAAGRTILKFLNAADAAVKRYSGPIGDTGRQIAYDLVNGLTGGLLGWGVSKVESAASALASHIPGPIKKLLGIASPSKLMMQYGNWVGEGLANGITAMHRTVEGSAHGLAQATINQAQKSLDIHSPSRVFYGIGLNVGQGFINGLVASLKNVRAAGQQMAQDTIDIVSKTASDAQQKADAAAAKAAALRDAAALLRHEAQNKKLSKAQKKSLKAQASHLDAQAKAAQKAADVRQGGIDAAAKRAADEKAFKEADAQGKADILNKRAEDAANAAEKDRKRAIELAKEADLIRQRDAKRAAQLEKQAQAALAASEKAAKNAKANASEAAIWAATAVVSSVADVQKQIDADKAAVELQAKLAGMNDQQKADYYTQQAKDEQAKSDAKYAEAEALLAKAKKEAKTNAEQARKDVAAAQQDVADAEAAKQAADEATQQAQQFADAANQSTDTTTPTVNTPTPPPVMPDTTIASSMVYGAQNMFDAYAKALAATTASASQDKGPTVIFEQHNTSPEALSPTEVYRQTNNLLSNVERKLTGALS